MVEARGRTGRPPSADEKKRSDRDSRREARLNRKPTWKSAGQRALIAGAFMFLFILVLGPKTKGDRLLIAIVYALVATLLYVFLGYYMELFLWRRRMAKKQAAAPRR